MAEYTLDNFKRAYADWQAMMDEAMKYTYAQFEYALNMLGHIVLNLKDAGDYEKAGIAYDAVLIDWGIRSAYMVKVLPLK